jgi:hypothetical protein
MKIPSAEFLETIERLYSVRYPEPYRAFCAQLADADVPGTGCDATGARLIADIDTFAAVNRRVGEEQWGDYERALAGQPQPKDQRRLWGDMLPFCVDEHCVYGFSADGRTADQVHVWSVHTIVHSYASLADFAEAHLRAWRQP